MINSTSSKSFKFVEAKLFYFVATCVFFSLLVFFYTTNRQINDANTKKMVTFKCLGGDRIYFEEHLPFIEESKEQPRRDGQNIFFLETSCSNNEPATLSARQACAVESVVRLHW